MLYLIAFEQTNWHYDKKRDVIVLNFLQLGIRKEINHTLKSLVIVEPTPIQERTIPSVLEGKNVIAKTQTGTGKTLAFVLSCLNVKRP